MMENAENHPCYNITDIENSQVNVIKNPVPVL